MDSKFKTFVIIALVILALTIGGSVFFIMNAINNNTQDAKAADPKAPVKVSEIALGDAIMTNIAKDEEGMQHYAKIQVSIGMDSSDEKTFEALTATVAEKSASIRSELIATIGEQTYTMLSNPKVGKEKLSDEIIARLNKLLGTDKVKEVYFQEYFVQ